MKSPFLAARLFAIVVAAVNLFPGPAARSRKEPLARQAREGIERLAPLE
jgi:lipopolysaccharide export LptBFGC system permease protein LptF